MSKSVISSGTDAHGKLGSYVAALFICAVLTMASFGAVMTDVLAASLRLPAIVVLCLAQLVVQLMMFLHIGSAKSQRDNTGIFICTAVLIVVVVAGSLWVMHNANVNMMPGM